MPRIIVLISFFITCLLFTTYAEDLKDKIVYKLAVLHTRYLHPEQALISPDIEPTSATIAEFQWIMDSLKNRCINPETAIADTILETWRIAKSKGYQKSLLEIARALSQNARSTTRFGYDKVNFRMTTKYWVAQQKP